MTDEMISLKEAWRKLMACRYASGLHVGDPRDPKWFERLEIVVEAAVKNRNRQYFEDVLNHYLGAYIDRVLRRIPMPGIQLEGRSLHFMSHAFGDWFRLPVSLNRKRGSFGSMFFEENIYAKFYDRYFRHIPTDFLVSLGSLEFPLVRDHTGQTQPQALPAFNKPTLVLVVPEENPGGALNTTALHAGPTITLPLATVRSIGAIVFTKSKDSFQNLIDYCNDYLAHPNAFLRTHRIGALFAKAKRKPKDDLFLSIEKLKRCRFFKQLSRARLNRHFATEASLSFMLSLYSVFTTDFAHVFSTRRRGSADKYYDESRTYFGFYFYPIVGEFTNRRKRGVFFVGFSITNQHQATNKVNEYLSKAARLFAQEAEYLYGLDSRVALRSIDGQRRILLEDLLIRCSVLSGRYRNDLRTNRARATILGVMRGEQGCLSAPISDRFCGKKPFHDLDPVKTITGFSDSYCTFIRDLMETARGNFHKAKSKKSASRFKGGQCIFLHSPPGCGKETIAKLAHLAARTAVVVEGGAVLIDRDRQMVLRRNWRANGRENVKDVKSYGKYPINVRRLLSLGLKDRAAVDARKVALSRTPLMFELADREIKASLLRRREVTFKFDEWWKALFTESYFTMNCALLSESNMDRMLFGSADDEDLSGMRRAGFLVGTAFLDEVNTLPKGVENRLLRLLEQPFEAIMHQRRNEVVPTKRIADINVLFVFASNKTPDELITEGYNSAFVGRIRQHYFEIPPMRERPEDIVLTFSSMLHDKWEETPDVGWKRIDLNAFRFISMLPWTDNLRGLRGFVDALALDRLMRGIMSETISFEEVVECAVRRNLIRDQTGGGCPDAQRRSDRL